MARVNKTKVRMKNKKRIIIAFGIIMLLMLILSLRTAWIQVVRADEYSEKAINQQMSDIPIEAARGSIYDKHGQELATSAICYSVWIRPEQIRMNYATEEKLDDLSRKLAVVLDQKATEVKADFNSKQPLIRIAKYLDKKTCDKIREMDISGLEIAENTKRYYPLGTSAANLLGSVSDDNEGRTGIEAEFDNYLSGVAGRWIKETDINGDTLSYGSQKYYQAKDGYNVHLTIDEVLQHYAEQAVSAGLAKTRAKRIMCIVMDPKTGDILSMVPDPPFDPNEPLEPISEAEKKAFNKLSDKEQAKYLSQMWKNPLVSDVYEPGSTWKLITTSAALEEGVTSPDDRYYDSGGIQVGDTVLHCWDRAGHGSQTLVEAVGNSCNTVQVQLGLKLGKEKYYNYLDMFGITDITHVDLPAETTAIIKDEKSLQDVDLATMSFGQSIAPTPIQLLTAACAIGNDGVLMKPRIVSKLTDSEGKVVKEYKTEKVRKVISAKTASEMKKIMEYVVEEGGGGNAAVEGYRIGGKTGTADKVVNGRYTKDTYSSFLGMAPMDDPRLAILVVVDSPKGSQYGSSTAAPIAGNFLESALTYLEITPNYEEGDENYTSSKVVYVPKVKGLTYNEAVAELKAEGLDYVVCPEGGPKENFKVVDQFPKAGASVKKGTAVYIYRE